MTSHRNWKWLHSKWSGLLVVAGLFVLMAVLSWRKWPDILVDFGTQLYIPWRILNGAVLYRDLFYFAGGPFSQYFNALLFKIFGVSFSTIIAANLILTAAMVFVLYSYFLAATDVWTATIIGLAVVVIFAFAEYSPTGNYNYIAPYSHEATHGLVFSVIAIALLSEWIKKEKTWIAGAAGFCAGIVFLTKPDIFFALAVAIVAAFILFYLKRGKQFSTSLAVFIFAGIIPSLFFLFYFLRLESLRDSLRSVVFGWLPLLHGAVTTSPLYRWCMGLDKPLHNAREIIIYFLAVVLAVVLFASVYALAAGLVKKSTLRTAWPNVFLIVMAAILLFWSATFDWRKCGWPLPLLDLSACILMAWNYKRLEQPVFPLVLSVFGLVLLAKLGLFPRIWHYGFALAMPAFVCSVYLLSWLLPVLSETRFGLPARHFRVVVGLVLLIGCGNLFHDSRLVYAGKNAPIGTGGDKIVTYDPASETMAVKDYYDKTTTYHFTSETSRGVYAALSWTQKYMPADATLAVLPEGVTLNYLTRRVNPTPCLFWDPNSIAVFGQSNMVAAFEKNPPDYIFIVERDTSEFGVGYFGSSPDFGLGLMQWIQKNYKTELLIGHEPLKNGLFGIKILKRAGSTRALGEPQPLGEGCSRVVFGVSPNTSARIELPNQTLSYDVSNGLTVIPPLLGGEDRGGLKKLTKISSVHGEGGLHGAA